MRLKYIGRDEKYVLTSGEVYEVSIKSMSSGIWVDIWYEIRGRSSFVSRLYYSPQDLAQNWCKP